MRELRVIANRVGVMRGMDVADRNLAPATSLGGALAALALGALGALGALALSAQAYAGPQPQAGAQAPASGGSSPADARCLAGDTPRSGQPGKDVMWIPTPEPLVERMLRLAEVGPTDTVYDLGSGDGRIVIAAAKLGARAVGVEYNPKLVALSRCLIAAAGLANRAHIVQGDLFHTRFASASVVTLFLFPQLDVRLRPELLALKPGTRIVSHAYLMGAWQPDRRIITPDGMAYLWIVPAHVDGHWTFRRAHGRDRFDVTLIQAYQDLLGTEGANNGALENVRLRGAQLAFDFQDGSGVVHLTGHVGGAQIDAKVTRDGHTSAYVGTRS